MKSLTKALRKTQTDAEKRLWSQLRNRQLSGCKFRRQHEIGHYIVDFICLEIKLIVELDGSQHAEQIARDRQRTAFLQSLGFKVIRFWDNEVLTQTQNVLEAIHKALIDNPSPHPLPQGERERNIGLNNLTPELRDG
jgi:very-short-patch-repair endonuclease